ncbi:uncharacterized protein LOC132724416 [Ruditapes philippinarum]|uniref:uncharacterized protein LOC132724416 n=1 Tax=Ruditapes philippinarum TaxID=129788 RepID=UPI00295BCB2E|nr:uncharacterized protein LOC132724416 [Ruditapes philippinarum]
MFMECDINDILSRNDFYILKLIACCLDSCFQQPPYINVYKKIQGIIIHEDKPLLSEIDDVIHILLEKIVVGSVGCSLHFPISSKDRLNQPILQHLDFAVLDVLKNAATSVTNIGVVCIYR